MSLPTGEWPDRHDAPSLERGMVHVWRTSLVLSHRELQRLGNCLSPDEQERAARMRLGEVRDRFVASRGRQRDILAAYRSQPPRDLRFEYGDLGKPRLAGPSSDAEIFFSLSNSHDMALLAVSRDGELGVDVEYVDRKSNEAAIANRFFAEGEKRVLAETPAGERKATFFRFWTCKEAVLKAMGVGLTFPLNRVEVSVAANAPSQVLALDDQLGRPEDWTLVNLKPAEKYVGALAFRHGTASVHQYTWTGQSGPSSPDYS